ncbi:unnamed protein product [Rotaria magnacalcarata]|uniref:Uncharacterized protein n=1 Tax=Rotaria magnacalcarata TaxID=392030 RepID=A0A816UKR1_9BILA|nr:unnamed protein product [Rotaria magnacalcarata]CAF3847820.1 unnamed protein product [Rotaria magnacalcarata]CAF3904319.1 unnamed protein product [Rotaria magnacalcarata]
MLDSQEQTQFKSVWETTNAAQTMPSAISASRSVSSIQPQYSFNTRQIYSYQPVQQPTWKSNNFQLKSYATERKNQKDILTMLLIGISISLIICGVPLTVTVTLYVQQKTVTASTAATSATSSTVSISQPSSSCSCDFGLATTWYLFSGSPGTQLTTIAVIIGYCGTNYPGCFNGTLPTVVGATTTGMIRVN